MKASAKSIILLCTVCFFLAETKAQYCNVTTAQSYAANMPGITNVTLNTINRNSASLECIHPCNSFVTTGVSTSLEVGQTYTFAITHTRDAVIFPNARNNIRVWIDYNQNFTLDDTNETVVSLDLQTFGTSAATFTVPASATPGSTRMRITAKMSDDAGHAIPTPCDNPPDSLSYHGEIEDYSVTITSTTGINGNSIYPNIVTIFPSPSYGKFTIEIDGEQVPMGEFEIYNVLGEKVYQSVILSSHNNLAVDISGQPNGIYLLKIYAGNKKFIEKIIVQ